MRRLIKKLSRKLTFKLPSKRSLKQLKWGFVGFLIPLLSLLLPIFLPDSSWSFNFIGTQPAASPSNLDPLQLLGIAILFFAILAIMVIIFYARTPPEKREILWGNILPKPLSPEQRVWLNNRFFFLIVFGGLYLSLAAIAAIPSLQETKSMPEEFSPNTLKVHINESLILFNNNFPTAGSNNLAVNPFTQLAKDDPFTALANFVEVGETNQVNRQNLDEIDKYLNQQRNKRTQLIDEGNNLLLITRQKIQKMSVDSITEYRANVVRIGRRENLNHFFKISQWFDININELESRLNSCLQTIHTANNKWKNTSEELHSHLIKNSSFQVLLNREIFIDPDFDTIKNQCKANFTDNQKPPEREELGASHGDFFKFLFGWLLKSESLPLAMIVGLIGFGLLGSACSSFVRESIDKTVKQANQSDNSLVKDLPKVFIIGLSAAILAFLSVMGGFSVLFTDASEPNPYSLLLVCLVAAAFGEDVWSSAQETLRNKLKNDRDELPPIQTSPIPEQQQLNPDNNTLQIQQLPSDSADQPKLPPCGELSNKNNL